MSMRKWVVGEFSWVRLIRFPIIVYVILVNVGLFFSDKLIFPSPSSSYSPDLKGLEFIENADGQRIATVFQKAPSEKYVALYFHGNAEDLGQVSENTYDLLRKGISVLAMDYPGYGLSEGKPTEESCQKAAEALYEKALQMGYKQEQILFWGRSLGGGVAMGLSETKPCHSVILESPFATAFTVKTVVPIVPFDKFHNLSRVKKLQTPLFLIHGAEDRIIHPRHSEKLYLAHTGKKERHLIPEAGHNDLWYHDTVPAMNALEAFLTEE